MKELLLYIARSLVEHPDQVTVTEVPNGEELTLELRVAKKVQLGNLMQIKVEACVDKQVAVEGVLSVSEKV